MAAKAAKFSWLCGISWLASLFRALRGVDAFRVFRRVGPVDDLPADLERASTEL
jgi:hypothetical protein